MLALVADTLDQHLQASSDQRSPPRERDRPLALEQSRLPLARDHRSGALRQLGGRRALLGAVDEGAQVVERRALDEAHEVLEVLLGLAREADDEGGAQEDARAPAARA